MPKKSNGNSVDPRDILFGGSPKIKTSHRVLTEVATTWVDADGKLHRDDKPAWISHNKKVKKWFSHGKAIKSVHENQTCLFTGDGFVVEDSYGFKSYYKDNRYHREDGPAVIIPDNHPFEKELITAHICEEDIKQNSRQGFYLNGVRLTRSQWQEKGLAGEAKKQA